MLDGMVPPLFISTVALFGVALLFRWLAAKAAVTPFDSYFYVLSTREVSRQKIGIAGELELALIPPQRVAVPYLLQAMFGLFPNRLFARFHSLIGPVADAAFAAFTFVVTIAVGFSQYIALMVFSLYVMSPAMFSRVALGPRVSSFTPRIFSEIAGNLFFIVLLVPLGMGQVTQIVLATILAMAILLLSKFGLQALLFLTPIAGLIAFDVRPVIAATLGLILAIAVTRGRCLASFRAQLQHLLSYAARNLRGETMISSRNSLKQLRIYLNTKRAIDSRPGKVLFYLLAINSWTCVLLKLAVSPTALVLIGWQWMHGQSIPLWLLAPILSATLVYIAVNIPALLFLGEAERYLYHVVYFFILAVAVGAQTPGFSWLIPGLIGTGLVYWCVETLLLPRIETRARLLHHEGGVILNKLCRESGTRRIALYPYHAIGVWRVLNETQHCVLYPTHMPVEERREFSRFEAAYPFLDLSRFPEIAEACNIDMLIVDVNAPIHPPLVLPFGWQRAAIQSDSFDIYRRIAKPADSPDDA